MQIDYNRACKYCSVFFIKFQTRAADFVEESKNKLRWNGSTKKLRRNRASPRLASRRCETSIISGRVIVGCTLGWQFGAPLSGTKSSFTPFRRASEASCYRSIHARHSTATDRDVAKRTENEPGGKKERGREGIGESDEIKLNLRRDRGPSREQTELRRLDDRRRYTGC